MLERSRTFAFCVDDIPLVVLTFVFDFIFYFSPQDKLNVEGFTDPKVDGVTLYLSDFSRPVADKILNGDIFSGTRRALLFDCASLLLTVPFSRSGKARCFLAWLRRLGKRHCKSSRQECWGYIRSAKRGCSTAPFNKIDRSQLAA